MKSTLSTLSLALLVGLPAVLSLSSYAADFVDPDFVLANNTDMKGTLARQSIVEGAEELALEAPWSVTTKEFTPPTGDKRDFMSWAPYWWPDCSSVGNTTELTPEQVWVTCPYINRDGEFNPDGRKVNDIGNFQTLSDAVWYNSMAWVITSNNKYSKNVAEWVNHWFLDSTTGMKPNLDYAQMKRGPDGQTGSQTGLLDLKGMVKIVNGLMILRKANSPDWTPALEAAFTQWLKEYVGWLETAPTSLGERDARNNHGTFWYGQTMSLKIYYDDVAGAKDTLNIYLGNQFTYQIAPDGEQPLEAVRTRPYHYRAYNLAAMITNARLAKLIGEDVFSRRTANDTTIQDALDFALTVDPGNEVAAELYPNIAAVAAEYGDPEGKYAAFLAAASPDYVKEPFFYWNQPGLSDSGLVAAVLATQSASGVPGAEETGEGGDVQDNAAAVLSVSRGVVCVVMTAVVVALL